MFGPYTVVALIPARGGSVGIPKKNLSKVGKTSLLERAIQCGKSRFVDRVVVSTDDEQIASVSADFGATIHMRSSRASTDLATAAEVVLDFVKTWLTLDVLETTMVLYLQPTSPLRNHLHVDAAFEAMALHGKSVCLSVVESEHSPYKSLEIDSHGILLPLFDEVSVTSNRQELPRTVRPNGALYIFPVTTFLENEQFPITGALGFEMSKDESIDIDAPRDLRLAELIIEERKGR